MVSKIKRAPDKSSYFLNVDLEIIARNPLDALIREMGRRVVVLFYGPIAGRRVLVLETTRTHKNPDSAITALCIMVEQFTQARAGSGLLLESISMWAMSLDPPSGSPGLAFGRKRSDELPTWGAS